MSDIARWAAFDGGIAPHPYGKWILFDDHQAEVERLTSERDEARAEVERLTVRLEHAQARIVPPLPHADESAQQVQDKMDGYIASVTTELRKTRHKLARVHAQYDEFAKVTAKVIEQHQRERDDARQQVYRLQQAGADRPTDEDIWREAFTATLQSPHFNRTKMADEVLAEYRKRWPR